MTSISNPRQERVASPPPPGVRTQECLNLQDGQAASVLLIKETALAISYGEINHAVMMVTPEHLEDFIYGFSFSEGVINHIDQILDMEWVPVNDTAIHANVTLNNRQQDHFRQQKRQRQGATGCGLCGVESLQAALPELPPLRPAPLPSTTQLNSLRDNLGNHQSLGHLAGAIHGALLLSPDGTPLACREDIGRHNALDKLLGYALRQRINLHGHAVVMSSRCSTELIQKAVRAGVSTLIHLASPSTLAVSQARQYGLNLIHLPRHSGPRLYAGAAGAAH